MEKLPSRSSSPDRKASPIRSVVLSNQNPVSEQEREDLSGPIAASLFVNGVKTYAQRLDANQGVETADAAGELAGALCAFDLNKAGIINQLMSMGRGPEGMELIIIGPIKRLDAQISAATLNMECPETIRNDAYKSSFYKTYVTELVNQHLLTKTLSEMGEDHQAIDLSLKSLKIACHHLPVFIETKFEKSVDTLLEFAQQERPEMIKNFAATFPSTEEAIGVASVTAMCVLAIPDLRDKIEQKHSN